MENLANYLTIKEAADFTSMSEISMRRFARKNSESTKLIEGKRYINKESLKIKVPKVKKAIREKEQGITYIIECEGYFKIGKATNMFERLQLLQTGNPFKLKLIDTIPINIERLLHRIFKKKKHIREWYKLEEEDILFIKSIKSKL